MTELHIEWTITLMSSYLCLTSKHGNSCPRNHTPGCSGYLPSPQNIECWSECSGQPGQWFAACLFQSCLLE